MGPGGASVTLLAIIYSWSCWDWHTLTVFMAWPDYILLYKATFLGFQAETPAVNRAMPGLSVLLTLSGNNIFIICSLK